MLPNYVEMSFPILQFIADKGQAEPKEIIEHIEKYFNLSDEEKEIRNKSGQQTYKNRTGWGIHTISHNKAIENDKMLIKKSFKSKV